VIATEQDARSWIEALPEWDVLAGERLERFVALLAEENARQNLVSAPSLGEVWRRHIVDSAQLLRFVPRGTATRWLDLGTGAGFPGLVIAILRPDTNVIMVESRARRIEWLTRVCSELGLDQAEVCGASVERLEARSVDVISARAFAPLERLLDLSARFSTASTTWLLPKGRSAQQELERLSGWNHTFHVEQSLTDNDAGLIVGHLLGRKGRKQP